MDKTDEGALLIEHRAGARRLGMRISIEANLASGVSLSRQMSSPAFAPSAVYIKHPAPKTTRHHDAYFRCPVQFGADQDAMLLSRDSLEKPNVLGDEGITKFLVSHLDKELSRIDDTPALSAPTKDEIARALSEGLPKMGDVAR